MTIDAVVFDDKQYSRLSSSRGYQLTHVGIAARRDSTPFSAADCESVLECLGYFLSFCRGAWTSPILLSGEDENGNVLGEVWRGKRIEPFAHTFSWVPSTESSSGSLNEAFLGYAQRWFSLVWADALRISTQWYVESSTGAIEKSLILIQTALELLTWVRLVEEQHAMTQQQWNDRRSFSVKLRQLLTSMSIPLSVPLPLRNLETHRIATQAQDGPEAFTYIRNTLVHPNLVRRARLNSTPQALSEAWFLGGWYLDLCMLNILGYSGSYSNRTIRQGWAGDEVENVPWL